MKTLIGVVAVVGGFLVADAHATFVGTVSSGTPVQLDVVASAANSASTATTVTLVRKGKLTARTFATQPGATSGLAFTPPRSSRVVVEVDAPAGGTADVTLVQGATLFAHAVSDDGRLVLDTTP